MQCASGKVKQQKLSTLLLFTTSRITTGVIICETCTRRGRLSRPQTVSKRFGTNISRKRFLGTWYTVRPTFPPKSKLASTSTSTLTWLIVRSAIREDKKQDKRRTRPGHKQSPPAAQKITPTPQSSGARPRPRPGQEEDKTRTQRGPHSHRLQGRGAASECGQLFFSL